MTTPPPPTLPTDTGQLGPGELTIGATGSSIDISCYLNNAAVEWTNDTSDSTTKLCGVERPGVTKFSAQLTGNVDVDAGNDSGLFALSWNSKGTVQDFTFTPNSTLGTTVTGKLTILPLRLGADNYGDDLTSDFTWDIVGDPVLAFAPVTP